MARQYSAFISYSHEDGEALAKGLQQRISTDPRGKGITFWQDYTNMHSGGWNRQIESAIESSEFLIMIITPSALLSPNCKDEWIFARKKGVSILPVTDLTDKHFYKQFPKWLETQHIYNPDKQWERFINDLNTRPFTLPVPFMARRQSEFGSYIHREEIFQRLKSLFLDPENKPINQPVLLLGIGGFGKTTLATVLCNDDEIILTFSDGILWVTLGQQADTLNTFKKLYEALTGEEKVFLDIENAQQILTELIERRNCLIVIDDAWRRQDLRPLFQILRNKAVLITSRFSNLLPDESISTVAVNEMKSSEGVQLLTSLFRREKFNEDTYRELAEKLNNWPLLLKLIGAQINQRINAGENPDKALEYVKRKFLKKGITAFDYENASQRNESVSMCINASIDTLEDTEKKLLTQLSIFPEDELIPFKVIAALWQLDEFDTEELLTKFSNRALIDIYLSSESIGIHDVLLKYYREVTGDGEMVKLHQNLTASLKTSNAFKSDYSYKFYLWHLSGAGKRKEAMELLQDFNWIEEKLSHTDIHDLLKDYEIFDDRNEDADLIYRTLKLSAYILANDPDQLPIQLTGRLRNFKNPVITELIRHASSWNKKSWLRPVNSAMNPATELENIFNLQDVNIDCPPITFKDKIIYGTWEGPINMYESKSGRLLKTRFRHEGAVSKLVLHKEKYLVSGADDCTVKICDLEKNEQLFSTPPFDKYISELISFGELVIAGTGDGTLIVIDISDAFQATVVRKHNDAITGIAASDSNIFTISEYDKTLRISDLFNPEKTLCEVTFEDGIESLLLHETQIYLKFKEQLIVGTLKQGKWSELNSIKLESSILGLLTICNGHLITCSGNDLVSIDASDINKVNFLRGHTEEISDICTKDNYVITGSWDKKVKIWSLETQECVRTFSGHSYFIAQLQMLGDSILSLEKNGQLFLWKFETSMEPDKNPHLKYESSGFVHPASILIYPANQQVQLINLSDMSTKEITLENDFTSIDADAGYMYVTDVLPRIVKMDLDSGKIDTIKDLPDPFFICYLMKDRIITDGQWISEKKTIQVRKKSNLELMTSFEYSRSPEIFLELEEQYLVITGKYQKEIDIRDWNTLALIQTIKLPDSLRAIASQKNRLIVVTEKAALTIDLPSFEQQLLNDFKVGGTYGYDSNEDYFLLEAGSTVLVYGKKDLQLNYVFDKHKGTVTSIKIAGSKVISSDYARKTYVWNIEDSQIFASLELDEPVKTIEFNRSTETIIFQGESSRIYFFKPVSFEFH